MTKERALAQIVGGGLAMVAAVALAFLMQLGIIPTTFLFAFVAVFLSLGGMVVGIYGVSQLVRPPRQDGD